MKKLILSHTFLTVLVFSIMVTPQTAFVEAQDFSIDVTPGTQSQYGPGNVTYLVTVSSSGGFHERVMITATISPGGFGLPNPTVYPVGGVTPPPNGVAHAVVVVWIKDPSGYTALQTITVTGSSAGAYHTTYAYLILTSAQGEFSLYAIPWSATIHPGHTFEYALYVFAIGTYTGSATLSAYGGPTTGASMYFNVTYTYITTPSLTPGATRYVTLTVTTTTAVEPGSYPIEIRGTGSAAAHSYYVILVIEATGDFTVAASQDTLSVNRGEKGNVTITVTSTGGFAWKTSLKWDWVGTTPTGATPSLSPSYVQPTSGGSKTSTLKIETTSSATLGTFKIMVTGSSYPRSHNVNITLTIASPANFTMTASPTSLSIVAGQTGTSTITIGSTGSFSSAVSMSFSWVGTAPAGVTPSLSAYSVTPPAGGTGTATLSIATSSTTTPGAYVVRITGVSGTLTHSVDVTFTVTTPAPTPDFTISVSPSSAQIRQGESGNFVVTIGSTNAFASSVSLTLSGQPSGVTGTFSPSSLTPPSGGSITSTLTVSVGATATPGTYTLTITGTSGSLSHQATIALTIPALPPCIIATATYGSELSYEVQFLRGFRDGQVLSTFAGSQFMNAFNAWYYSFSPYIAQFIASNAFARGVMKVLLYPLIGILRLASMTYNAFSFSHELAVFMAGLVASALIGIVYFSPLAILALVLLRRYRKTTLKMSQLRMLAIVWVASLLMILVGEVALLPALMMASAALFVLSTLSLGALTVATALLRRIQ